PVVAGVPLDLVLQDPQVGRQVGVVKHGAILAGGRQAGLYYTLPTRLQRKKGQGPAKRKKTGAASRYRPGLRNSLIDPKIASRSGTLLTTTFSCSSANSAT